MPDSLKLEVTGLDEAIRGLSQIGTDWKVFAIARGLNAAGDIMKEAVDYYTPIRLDANSEVALDWSGHQAGGGGLKEAVRKVVVVNSDGSGGTVTIDHGALSYVAAFLEYGHRMIGHKPGLRELKGPRTSSGFVKPYPIYRPAAEASAQAAVDAFTDSIMETVRRNIGTEGVAA